MAAPSLAEAAADAFTEGWLLSGADGEFTEAELSAAIGAALDCADHPDVLETSLILGSLQGTWKTVYDRRERLLRKHLKAVLAAWNACLADLDTSVLVRQFRAVMDHTAEAVDTDRQWWKDAATTAAIGWLRALYRTDGYPALVAAVEDAIRSGMAEGEADALALAASRQGKTGFSIAKAFKAAYARLADDHRVSQQAADTITAIVAGAAGDAGRVLAGQAGDGGSEDDMASAVDDTLTKDDGPAGLGTDWALYAAILAGASALYSQLAGSGSGTGAGQAASQASGSGTAGQADGQILLAWISAGDGRVCLVCSGYEDNSPYTPENVPNYPHPRCRCSVDLAPGSGSSSFLAALLDLPWPVPVLSARWWTPTASSSAPPPLPQ
jgi:hypothetical protein